MGDINSALKKCEPDHRTKWTWLKNELTEGGNKNKEELARRETNSVAGITRPHGAILVLGLNCFALSLRKNRELEIGAGFNVLKN